MRSLNRSARASGLSYCSSYPLSWTTGAVGSSACRFPRQKRLPVSRRLSLTSLAGASRLPARPVEKAEPAKRFLPAVFSIRHTVGAEQQQVTRRKLRRALRIAGFFQKAQIEGRRRRARRPGYPYGSRGEERDRHSCKSDARHTPGLRLARSDTSFPPTAPKCIRSRFP